MTIRVLVVDDSWFISKRIKEILEEEPEFKIVGIAKNGKEALEMAAQLEPDVITMDVEMPVMNGIKAVQKIMSECPTGILMFSAATHAGAQATLDALNAGAIDFLPKQLRDLDANKETAKQLLRHRVRMVANQKNRIRNKTLRNSLSNKKKAAPTLSPIISRAPSPVNTLSNNRIDLLVIVASTGGPVAIQKVLTRLPSDCSFPILIVQHMPENFTKSFSERLNQLCKVTVKEAEHGDELKPGLALLAPGGVQIELKNRGRKKTVSLRIKQKNEIYSPCADITLTSIAEVFSAKVLTVVLTGMGADGKEGATKLKHKGAQIWAQDEASCTIYGMPKAIVDAKIADKIYSLDKIACEFENLR